MAEPIDAFASIWRNRALRRLEFAWAGSIIGTWAFAVALGVYAYGHGGAAAVGLAGLLRTVPTMLFAAFLAPLADRHSRVAVMVASDLVRALLYGLAVLCIVGNGPPLVVYIIGGALMLTSSVFRPAQSALLPSLTETPEQLTAMNVVSSTIESVGFFAGPALGGILLVATNVQMVFVVSGLSCLWSAALLLGLRHVSDAARASSRDGAAEAPSDAASGFLHESIEGFRTIGRDRKLVMLVSLFTAQTLVAGAVNVFIVVLALRLYESGPGGVGTLNAATGVGGIIGAGAAAMLVGGERLARGFAFGMVFWSAPLLLVAGVPAEVIGLVAMAVIGVANTVIDVSAFTLFQRAVPDEVLARVFGVLETVLIGGIGLGALLTPLIIDALGLRGALLAVGASLPLLTALTWSRLRALDVIPDAPKQYVELLRSVRIFQAFPTQTIELLASKLERHDPERGDAIVREGDTGDRFYVIEQGRFGVEVEGEQRAELGPGDFFGEIALLRDVPRTATVTALDDGGVLLSLARDDFVPAVRVELLKSLAMFRPLPAPTLEFLASKLVRQEVRAGDVVIREGTRGDRFYLIEDGRFDVAADSQPRCELARGDFFGEIALLRDVERTATVTAVDDGVLFSLGRDEFVPAVTGSAPANAAADEVVGARIAALAGPRRW